MKYADESEPSKNIVPEEQDLGPEPDWLADEVVDDSAPESQPSPDTPETVSDEVPEEVAQVQPAGVSGDEIPESNNPAPPPPSPEEVAETTEINAALPTAGHEPTSFEDPKQTETKEHPWLWGLAPFVFLLATGLVAWFGTTQTLNGRTTWEAIRMQGAPLLPAQWAMMIWWAVLPLMTVFLIYGSLPMGREPTRIKFTGPLISIGLAATTIWIFAQHWRWELIGIVSMAIAVLAIAVSYFMVALGPGIKTIRQRMIAMIPLSAALGYSVMLTVLSWQNYSSQPFGERGSSVLFTLLVVVAAAAFAFFLRDGLFALTLAIWFAGVVHLQWGDDAVISLVAAVAVLFSGALAILGGILAMESHKPAFTTSLENRRNRTSFFKKSEDQEGE